jgi:AraC family transcriptional regulator
VRHLPDHHDPAIYSPRRTPFRWHRPGLLLPDEPTSFVAHFATRRAEFPEHPGLLSIKAVFSGREVYGVETREVAVNDAAYLVLNEGETYSSHIDSAESVESLSVFFEPGFAADVLRTIVTDDDRLLEAPGETSQPVTFFQHLYSDNDELSRLLGELRSKSGSCQVGSGWLEEQLHLLLDALIVAHRGATSEARSLESFRRSIRVEIYRRLRSARDLMESRYEERLMLPQLAAAACMSPHHFLRSFRRAFGETPHQYLTRRRLDAARRLLLTTDESVTEVALAVGFDTPGSFGTLFRRKFGTPPARYRELHGNRAILKKR